MYSNLSGDSQENIQNIQGGLFMLLVEVVYSTVYRPLRACLTNTPLLRRECNEHIYSVSAHYVACNFSEFPFLCLEILCGLAITFSMAEFAKGFQFFFQVWLLCIMLVLTMNAYSLMLAGVFRALVLEIPTVFNLIIQILSGAYISLAAYPYLRYISPLYYAYEAISIFYWHDVKEIRKL